MARYDRTAELPDYAATWKDSGGALINFSTGYTFKLELFPYGSTTATLTKTTGITGAATDPNVVVAWTAAQLNLAAGVYRLKLTATRTADSKDRVLKDVLVVE